MQCFDEKGAAGNPGPNMPVPMDENLMLERLPESDIQTGKLDQFANEAVRQFKAGQYTEL